MKISKFIETELTLAYLEGYVAGAAAGECGIDPAADVELLETLEPDVNCQADDTGESDKGRVLNAMRVAITAKVAEFDGGDRPMTLAQRQTKLEEAWLETGEYSPEEAGAILADYYSPPNGLWGEAAILRWQRRVGDARRRMETTREGLNVIAFRTEFGIIK